MHDSPQYAPLYLEGIRYFNECDFYESHESWEELWADEQGPARKFYQGMIQAAVALHHFGNGNIRGARKLYYTSRGYLEPYRPAYLGLDLDSFLAAMGSCFADIVSAQRDADGIEIDADRIPEIRLDPPPGDSTA